MSAKVIKFPSKVKAKGNDDDRAAKVRARLESIQDQLGVVLQPICAEHATIYVVMAMLELTMGGIHALHDAGAIDEKDIQSLAFRTARQFAEITKGST